LGIEPALQLIDCTGTYLKVEMQWVSPEYRINLLDLLVIPHLGENKHHCRINRDGITN
jgi:hypothetical protein